MSFSSAVVLTDLNDFISPQQDCIKPVEMPEKTAVNAHVEVRENGDYYQVSIDGTEEQLKAASITLQDCLACSGCITSAETILIQMQHDKELTRVLEERRNTMDSDLIIVVSISSQARASLALKWGLDSLQIWTVLVSFFKTVLGIDHVFDIDFARDISLLESGKEFMTRFTANQTMLASSCPGWVCYAEKTHPTILPLLDSTKSPQQVMGSLVKDYLVSKMSVAPNKIYHVAIMPCYDKKLEASRTDFYNDVYATRDVDLVLSTTEVEKMIEDLNVNPLQLEPSPPSSISFTKEITSPFSPPTLARTAGSSSGGYLSWILRHAVRTLYNISLSPLDISLGRNGVSIIPGRNSDFTQVNYTPPGGAKPTLRFAYAYGFRNIQNLVRKLKPKRGGGGEPVYHFVEVMACPSGCINGGGQARQDVEGAMTTVLNAKEWIEGGNAIYGDERLPILDPDENREVRALYEEWIGEDEERRRSLLHTGFHAVENSFQSLAVKW